MYYLMKFGYDGRCFTGYQRGNGKRSVEDSILYVMRKYGISEGISSAARTDRGVSAAGNVIYFKSRMQHDKISGILNSKIKDAIFHSYAITDSEFRVRFSKTKHYRYLLLQSGINIAEFRDLMEKFVGTHDFSMFSRRDSRSPIRTVERVETLEKDGLVEVNVYGPNFVWNQIRSMVGFALYYAKQDNEPPEPFSVEKRTWPIAVPEYLVLMDIEYKDVDFNLCLPEKKKAIWISTAREHAIHSTTLCNILEKTQSGRLTVPD